MAEPRPKRIELTPIFGPEPTSAPGDKLPWAEVERWLVAASEVWVVTAGPAGRPHAVPVDMLWVDREAIIGAPPASRRGRNVAANPEVVIHLPGTDNVAIIEGRAEPLLAGPIADRAVEAGRARYGDAAWPAERLVGITWRVRPRAVMAWRVGDMRETATRWLFG